MSAESMATFEVTDAALAAAGAVALAERIVAHVDDPAIVCGDVTSVGSGARFVARVGRQRVPVFVGPVPPDADDAGRWFLSIGSAVMPLARVLGGRDESARGRLTTALGSAVADAPGIGRVRWRDGDDQPER